MRIFLFKLVSQQIHMTILYTWKIFVVEIFDFVGANPFMIIIYKHSIKPKIFLLLFLDWLHLSLPPPRFWYHKLSTNGAGQRWWEQPSFDAHPMEQMIALRQHA